MSSSFPVSGTVSVLLEKDVDTDIIFPARFLLLTDKLGLGRYAFADRRDDDDFPLPVDQSSPILVAGANFGCGSSREHAVWALHDFGIRVILAPSFGEIFYSNCIRNGILPVCLPRDQIDILAGRGGNSLIVDLENYEIRDKDVAPIRFDIAEGHREALLKGWDETDRIVALYSDAITTYEMQRKKSGCPL